MKHKILIFLILTIFTSCNDSLPESQLEDLVANEPMELELVCKKFLSKGSIQNIAIPRIKDSNKCNSINNWILCGGQWESWNETGDNKIYLPNIEEVLKSEKIEQAEYNYYVQFLQKSNLESILRVYQCDNCVDLESSVTGLRYSNNKKYLLKEDFEYLSVKRINDNWFVYTRDWN